MSIFQPFPKIPRLNRDCVITEKIDGTNAAVYIAPYGELLQGSFAGIGESVYRQGNHEADLVVYAQSRSRLITPEKGRDNAGFAAWVAEHGATLADVLGPGRHFGEWYGQGIQRGYGMDHKEFALFNTTRWDRQEVVELGLGLDVVPVLYEGIFHSDHAESALSNLAIAGSRANPGFMRPEGIMVYHTAANQYFKATIENDASWKGNS